MLFVLLPLYYRLQLTSIYRFLGDRIGAVSYKTGAGFFLVSRSIGASFRLYLVVLVLNETVLPEATGAASWLRLALLVAALLAVIWAYTRRGGIATVVWTDTLQTAFMLLAAGTAFVLIAQQLGLSILEIPSAIAESGGILVFTASAIDPRGADICSRDENPMLFVTRRVRRLRGLHRHIRSHL